ncbi:MAG TPA: Uma2 family endonuclease [Thermoanaerobaculia bacterium]|nr:Uma2 family endonuclease [Thermoanaerobaculia bacterium]
MLEEAPLAPPAGLGPYRQRDYDGLPEQPRCELLFGRIYVTASPTLSHQTVAQQVWLHLRQFGKLVGGRAYLAPVDVVLADHSVVQPDVVYVSPGRLAILRERVEGAPDLLVEVLSPGSARRDRGEKLALYALSGVREYWVVDPVERQIEFLVNEAGRFVVSLPVAGEYCSSVHRDLRLDIAEFWRQCAAELPPGP